MRTWIGWGMAVALLGGCGGDDGGGPCDCSSNPPKTSQAGQVCHCPNTHLDASLACSPVGTYERGKGDTTPDCCPSLHQVERLVPSYGADGTMACGRVPLASFMCIEGTCGDGVCEPTEDQPCGCLADCPNAAFGSWDGGGGF